MQNAKQKRALRGPPVEKYIISCYGAEDIVNT